MTTHAPIAASLPSDVAVPTELDLESQLVLTAAIMDARLASAALKFEVNTAHIPVEDLAEVVAPLPLTPTLAPAPYSTPIADLLHRARQRIEQDGWCRDALYDEEGGICPIRAIRLEAANRGLADDACVLLLEAIQRDFHWAETIPSWNAQQTGAAPVLICFDRAAQLAHTRHR
ncbi:hypothetical protein [Streptomyces sp. NPDC056723]|uniref:DUF6197 family protein n=1 Tax=Streptomyces sp. NPDC056723 TaxID=3345925 RepID=UPI00367D25DB